MIFIVSKFISRKIRISYFKKENLNFRKFFDKQNKHSVHSKKRARPDILSDLTLTSKG